MSIRIKHITLYFIILFGGFLSSISYGQEYEGDSPVEMVPQIKTDARKALNPFRLDGYSTTYYAYKAFEQQINITILLSKPRNYRLSFNSNAVDDPIKFKIYDKPSNYKSRIVIYERTGVSQGEFLIEMDNILKKYKEAKIAEGMSAEDAVNLHLSKIYIDYVIPAIEIETEIIDKRGTEVPIRKQGAIVIAMGYANI